MFVPVHQSFLPAPGFPGAGFAFLDPFPLVDGVLELVRPSVEWIDSFIQSADSDSLTREDVELYLQTHPDGLTPGDPNSGRVPAYLFWMLHRQAARIVGNITLRVGSTDEIRLYYGNVGYAVGAGFRGHHYAERATRLLYPLCRRHGLRELWITTDPDNRASIRTCERLGAEYLETVEVPSDCPLHALEQRRKRRYRVLL